MSASHPCAVATANQSLTLRVLEVRLLLLPVVALELRAVVLGAGRRGCGQLGNRSMQLTRRSALGSLVVLLGRARRGSVARGGGLVVLRRGSTGGRRKVLAVLLLRGLLVPALLVSALLRVSALLLLVSAVAADVSCAARVRVCSTSQHYAGVQEA